MKNFTDWKFSALDPDTTWCFGLYSKDGWTIVHHKGVSAFEVFDPKNNKKKNFQTLRGAMNFCERRGDR